MLVPAAEVAQAVTAAPGVPPSEWLYIIAALGTILATCAAIRSAWRKYIRQRQAEAVEKSDLLKAIADNAEATRANTAAMGKLSLDFHDFAGRTQAQLNGYGERIGRLERP
jgi:hypothetical protein